MITVQRSIAAASFEVLFVFALVVSGLFTNWFRYFPSLEAMFVMAPLLVALLISAVVTRRASELERVGHLRLVPC